VHYEVNRLYDPIAAAQFVTDSYTQLARSALEARGLGDADIECIMESLEPDRGLFLSVNPRHETSSLPFRRLCEAIGLHRDLPRLFPGIKRLHAHQEHAVQNVLAGQPTVIATGTGSGKTESFLIPIMDYCLRERRQGIKAIIIYPTNALATDQLRRIGECASRAEITYGVYTGDTPYDESRAKVAREGPFHLAYRSEMLAEPPNILVTNHVMLDRMLTRPHERHLFTDNCRHLRFVVMDEIHSYRGHRATHLRFLLRRLRKAVPNPVVQICCSATLASEDAVCHVDRFICPLLDVASGNYILVRPVPKSGHRETSPLTDLNSTPIGAYKGFQYDPASMDSSKAAMANLNALLGTAFARKDFVDPCRLMAPGGPRALLLSSSCMQAIADSLSEGSKSMDELVETVARAISNTGNPEDILRGCLAAASLVDSCVARTHPDPYDRPDPVLDFRAHLFMREIQGMLKRCIRCGKYHGGQSESCILCGAPLFMVYSEDASKCVARLYGNSLLAELGTRESSPGLAVYVLVGYQAPASKLPKGAFRASIGEIDTPSSIEFASDVNGWLCIERLRMNDPGAIQIFGIHLSPAFADYHYVHCIARSMLSTTEPNRKLLAFVDSREQATRHAAILDDEFASSLFEEMLRIYCANRSPRNVEEAFTGLREELGTFASQMSERERELAQEFGIWFARFISRRTDHRSARREFLRLANAGEFSASELEVLSVFVEERAILKEAPIWPESFDGQAIRYSLRPAKSHEGIHFEGQRSDEYDYPGTALSTNPSCSRRHMVARIGEATVKRMIANLVRRNVLFERPTPDGKQYFYISPRQLKFNLGPPRFATISEAWYSLADRPRPHSAEIKREDRIEIERGFAEGNTSVVVATPTLELGIDIGKLQAVLLIGVPPTPANYAQRAGRAGRGQAGGHSLIVTLCSERNPNDMIYFRDPRRMIDGFVSPPVFNDENRDVAIQHISAMAFAGHVSDSRSFRQRISEIAEAPERLAAEIGNVIDVPLDLGEYLKNQLYSNASAALLSYTPGADSFEQFLYNQTNLMPDFAFRDDPIFVCTEDGLRGSTLARAQRFTDDIVVSSRDPELAAYMFVPGQQVHMAGDVYSILADGDYQARACEESGSREIRIYRAFAARKADQHASKHPRLLRQDIVYNLDRIDYGRNLKGVLWVGYSRTATLAIQNRGALSADTSRGFGFLDESKGRRFIIEYPLERETLVLGFERDVCREPSMYMSASMSILRGIKSHYKLDDSEVGMMVDLLFDPCPDSELPGSDEVAYVALYDATGNNCLRLENAYADLHSQDLLGEAYQILASCDCDRHGCHRCLRGYESRPWAGQICKDSAIAFLEYLMGEGKFRPQLPPVDDEPVPDITLEVMVRGSQIELCCNGRRSVHPVVLDQNTEVFSAMNKVILECFRPNMRCIRIIARDLYIRRAISHRGSADKGREALADLLVTLSMFKHVEAVDTP